MLCHDESQYLLHSLFTDKDSRLCPDNCNVAHTFFHGKKAPIEFCCTVCSCQSWHHAPPHARLMQQCDAVGRPSMAFANVDFAQLSSFCSHFSLHLQYISYPAGGTLHHSGTSQHPGTAAHACCLHEEPQLKCTQAILFCAMNDSCWFSKVCSRTRTAGFAETTFCTQDRIFNQSAPKQQLVFCAMMNPSVAQFVHGQGQQALPRQLQFCTHVLSRKEGAHLSFVVRFAHSVSHGTMLLPMLVQAHRSAGCAWHPAYLPSLALVPGCCFGCCGHPGL